VPLELWLVGCSQSYSFFPVTHKNFLAYYMCGIVQNHYFVQFLSTNFIIEQN
jgi:hypothetical protein